MSLFSASFTGHNCSCTDLFAAARLFPRFRTSTFNFDSGEKRLRHFSVVTCLSKLPKMTGNDYIMLLTWFPAILQTGEGVVSAGAARVRIPWCSRVCCVVHFGLLFAVVAVDSV